MAFSSIKKIIKQSKYLYIWFISAKVSLLPNIFRFFAYFCIEENDLYAT